jgi:hypothetical protein
MPTQEFEELFYHLEQASKGARSLNLQLAIHLLSIAVLEITEQEQRISILKQVSECGRNIQQSDRPLKESGFM